MPLIDLKTVVLMHTLNCAICCAVLFLFFRQDGRRSRGLGLWLFCYLMQLLGFVLITLRGTIPDFLSIVLANIAIFGGFLALLIGLERYVGKSLSLVPDITVSVAFLAVLFCFTYLRPLMWVRVVNVSAGSLFVAARILVLMLSRVDPESRRFGRPVGIIAVAICLINLFRIVENLLIQSNRGFFDQGIFDALVLLANQLILVALTFSLVLMASGRLLGALGDELLEREAVTEKLRRSEEKFQRAFQTSPNVILISRLDDGMILEVNDTFTLKFGYTAEEALSSTTIALRLWVHPFDRVSVVSALSRGEKVVSREYAFRKKNGETLVGIYSSHILTLEDDSYILSVIQDITQRKKMEEDLRRSRELLSDIIEYSGALVCVKDREGRYKLVNTKWEEVVGLGRDAVVGKTDAELFPGEMGAQYRSNDVEAINFRGVREHEEIYRDENGERVFLSVKFPLFDENGEIEAICGMMTEITERKHDEELIRHMANHDPLTDLPTLRLARDRLAIVIASVLRHECLGAILFIDLDGFKDVNDTYGHDAGNLVLKAIADRLRTGLRSSDTAARIGGDEFLVILNELDGPAAAESVARKIIARVNEPISLDGVADGKAAHVGVSVGMSLFPQDGRDIDTLIRKADEAMYSVKNNQKNDLAFAPPG